MNNSVESRVSITRGRHDLDYATSRHQHELDSTTTTITKKSKKDVVLTTHADGLEPEHSSMGWTSPESEDVHKASRVDVGDD